jgi:cytochrome c556
MAAMRTTWPVFVVILAASQQTPAPAPTPTQQKPVVPVAASTIAANLDRFAGTTVSVTAAVGQRYGATAFSVAQTRSAARSSTAPKTSAAVPDVLVVAPLLTSPVQPGAYVTVIGEVIRFDSAVVAARMKDAAPPADIAAKYAGKPAVLATSVINASMTDLAKKLPPPMTPAEIDLNKAMKQISPAFTALRQAVTASNTSDARDQASALASGFTAAAAFWKTQSHPEATEWTEDARKLADEIAMLAAKPDLDGLKASVPKLQQICSNCHNQYRVRLDDGSYRYKDAVSK